jgi:hypothetical protein
MATLNRVFGATNLTTSIGYTGSEAGKNSFSSVKPWSDIKEITDEYGNVWIQIPKFYTKYVMDENGVIKERYVSEFNGGSGWHLNPIFRNSKGAEIDQVCISKYLVGEENGQLYSKSGMKPYGQVKPSTARSKVAIYEDEGMEYEYSLFDIWALIALQDLFIIEFANSDSNSVMQGIIYEYYKEISFDRASGKTDIINAPNGSTAFNANQDSDGSYAMKYRGIENLWGNGRVFIDGIVFNGKDIYYCNNSAEYGDRSKYINANVERIVHNGLVHQLTYDENSMLVMPKTLSNNGSYDNYYEASTTGIDTILYLGAEGSGKKIGLFSFITDTPIGSELPKSVYRMVRK